jgi:uncharacterized RDD family membrane protein YckC
VYDVDKPSQTIQPNDASPSSSIITTSPPSLGAGRLVLGTLLSILGRVLALCGTMVVLAGFLLFPLLLLYTDWSTGLELSVMASGVGLAVVVLGLTVQLYSKRLRLQNAQQILAKDARDPVVYLRPFVADAQSTHFREVGLFSEILSSDLGLFSVYRIAIRLLKAVPTLTRLAINPPLTDEEQLAMALNVFGPAVAVATPGEKLPPAGIPRLHFVTSQWQEQVSALLHRAGLVVIQCGESKQGAGDAYWPTARSIEGGFRWELDIVARQVPPEKLVLLLPSDGVEYETFCWKVQDIFPCKLPRYWGTTSTNNTSRALVWFDATWKPFLAPLTWLDGSLRLDTRYPSVASLRSKFQAFTGEGFDLTCSDSKLGKRLIAVILDLLFAVGVTTLLTLVVEALWHRHNNATFVRIAVVMLPIIACTYSCFFEASPLMATSGKRLVGLMVVDRTGLRLSFSRALQRAIAKYFLLPITWLPALFANDKQTLHDRFANSMVALGALRLSEPSKRFAALPTYIFVPVMYFAAIGLATNAALSPLYFPKGTEKVVVPFKSPRGYIVLPASLNGQPLNLLLSTSSAVTTIDRNAARRIGIRALPMSSGITLGGKEVLTDVSFPYHLKLASVLVTNVKLYIVDLSTLTFEVGVQVDGVIGFDLLNRGIVQIDYADKDLIIAKSESFYYAGSGESIRIATDRRVPLVVGTIKIAGHEAVEDTFWLNPVVPGGVNHPLIRYSTGAQTVSNVPSSMMGGLKIGRIEYIQLGKVRLERVLSVCCTGYDGVDRQIGSAALSQFNVIFDYPHGRVILDPRNVVRAVLRP